MKAAVLYWSKTGNTEKVARAIQDALATAGVDVLLRRIDEAADVEWFDYDLICVGFPSYQWQPPKPVAEAIRSRFGAYQKAGRVKPGAPALPGTRAVIFCTYSGPHTGIREAIPAGKYVGQFFEHVGIEVVDEWYVVGELHGSEEMSTAGRLGDIRGRPNEDDLSKVRQDVARLVQGL